MINQSLEKLKKLNEIWAPSDFENKRALQKLLFPEGIYYNAEMHKYRTRKVNGFIELVNSFSIFFEQKEKENSQSFFENSLSVVRKGVEPLTL